MNAELKNEVAEKILSNYFEVDTFYVYAAKDVIDGIIIYIEYLYDEEVTEKIAMNELLNLFSFMKENDYPASYFWEMAKKQMKINLPPIDFISMQSLNDTCGYISAAIVTGYASGAFIEDEIIGFLPKIPNYICNDLMT